MSSSTSSGGNPKREAATVSDWSQPPPLPVFIGANVAAANAQGMADIAKVIPSVFPEGSGEGKTEALAKSLSFLGF